MKATLASLGWRRGALALAAVALFAVGVDVSRSYEFQLGWHRRPHVTDPATQYVPTYRRERGRQLMMVYVGTSRCGWSNRAPLPDAVETIKRRLAGYATERGMSFKAVGVALDWSPRLGLEHLAKFGLFDEVSAGYNWGNSLALEYLWSDASVRPATPGVLVYERILIAPADSGDALHYEEKSRRRLIARAGLNAILEWARSGQALPEEPEEPDSRRSEER